jgi:PEP-CTERM motif-containing protein
MKFSKAVLAIAAVVPFAALTAPANAATVTYDWTMSGTSVSLGGPEPGSGTLTVTTGAGGVDTITAITGEIGGSTITSLIAPNGFEGNDNLLYPNGTPTVLDTDGLAFTAGTAKYEIYSFFAQGSTPSPGDVNFYSEIGTTIQQGSGTFSVSPVPLPASWTMMLLGLCGLGFVATRSNKKNSAHDPLAGFSAA